MRNHMLCQPLFFGCKPNFPTADFYKCKTLSDYVETHSLNFHNFLVNFLIIASCNAACCFLLIFTLHENGDSFNYWMRILHLRIELWCVGIVRVTGKIIDWGIMWRELIAVECDWHNKNFLLLFWFLCYITACEYFMADSLDWDWVMNNCGKPF